MTNNTAGAKTQQGLNRLFAENKQDFCFKHELCVAAGIGLSPRLNPRVWSKEVLGFVLSSLSFVPVVEK